MDYYKILHVDPSADAAAISAAYRRLMRKYHPDANPSPDATQRAQEINEAYAVLGNPARRAQYNREHGIRMRVRDRDAALRCPHHQLPLTAKLFFGTRVHECPRCEGMWIGRASLVQLYSRFDMEPPAMLTGDTPSPHAETDCHAGCPDDGTPLVTRQCAGVNISACPQCLGVWLSAADFSKIVIRQQEARRAVTIARIDKNVRSRHRRVWVAGLYGVLEGVLNTIASALDDIFR